VGGSLGLGGGWGTFLCGNGQLDAGEACDSGLPWGDETCDGRCRLRCAAPGAEAVVDPATGHCYLLFSEPVAWQAARSRCLVLPGDAHLLALNAPPELAFVAGALLEQLGFDDPVWTGGNDLAAEGAYAWESGEPLAGAGEFPWDVARAQPGGGTSQNCAAAVASSGFLLDDRACSEPNAAVCERAPAAPAPPPPPPP
jgi:hypothetical protein